MKKAVKGFSLLFDGVTPDQIAAAQNETKELQKRVLLMQSRPEYPNENKKGVKE